MADLTFDDHMKLAMVAKKGEESRHIEAAAKVAKTYNQVHNRLGSWFQHVDSAAQAEILKAKREYKTR